MNQLISSFASFGGYIDFLGIKQDRLGLLPQHVLEALDLLGSIMSGKRDRALLGVVANLPHGNYETRSRDSRIKNIVDGTLEKWGS